MNGDAPSLTRGLCGLPFDTRYLIQGRRRKPEPTCWQPVLLEPLGRLPRTPTPLQGSHMVMQPSKESSFAERYLRLGLVNLDC